MKILLIAPGYLPYTFSENLCNGKLAYAMYNKGWHVDVISKVDEGPTYSDDWTEPWLPLKESNYSLSYRVGGSMMRIYDTLRSSFRMRILPEQGIRWACRAYELALKLCREKKYDAVLTRSPSDISHIIGLRLKEETGIFWMANWNDPAAPIWPEPYTHQFSDNEQARKISYTEKCLRAADINTFPSQSLLDHFIDYFPFLTNQKTAIIPHIALDESLVPKVVAQQKNSVFRMCHSGNLSAERNPELTFKAMRELIDEGYDKLELSIMGYINDYTADLIKKYYLQGYVKYIGGFPYMEAMKIMQDYDCFVLLEACLKRGIFSASKFTDYAQLGKPILAISPAVGFAASTLKQFGGGLSVDNEDYKSIKAGIVCLYKAWQHHSLALNYSAELLYKQFNADHVIAIYESLLGRSS